MFSWFKKPLREFRAEINGETITVSNKRSILTAALDNDVKFPNRCRVGGCATCKCKLVSGEVKELTDSTYLLDDEELDAGYILACQSVPQSDIVIEIPSAQERAAKARADRARLAAENSKFQNSI